jgi:hypothetical protein
MILWSCRRRARFIDNTGCALSSRRSVSTSIGDVSWGCSREAIRKLRSPAGMGRLCRDAPHAEGGVGACGVEIERPCP